MRSATFVLCVFLVGCAASSAKRGEELMESVMTYNDGLRWDRLASAASRVPPAEREDFIDEHDELSDNLRITDWEVIQLEHVGKSRARVQVKYTWYLDDEGIVRETQTHQKWEKRAKAWLLVEEEFARGDEMPGVM
jgi:hypothetical protein